MFVPQALVNEQQTTVDCSRNNNDSNKNWPKDSKLLWSGQNNNLVLKDVFKHEQPKLAHTADVKNMLLQLDPVKLPTLKGLKPDGRSMTAPPA